MLSERTNPARGIDKNRQHQKVLLATLLVLIAVAIIVVKDGHSWFGSDSAVDVADEAQAASNSSSDATTTQAPVAATNSAKKHVAEKTSAPATAAPAPAAESDGLSVMATNRQAIPPLDVEVVSGDDHEAVHPGSNSIKVEIPVEQKSALKSRNGQAVQMASAREPIPTEQKFRSAGVEYPMLTPQSRVQGSVVMQVRIGADGVVEDLRIVSGPAILASAAREAVRRWQFKPYIQNGQAVETVANITVNFTIKVAGNPEVAS